MAAESDILIGAAESGPPNQGRLRRMVLPVTLADVEAAAAAIAGAVVGHADRPSQTLSEITGADVWMKFENLQFTASFKERGACNFLLRARRPTGPRASWPRPPATTRKASPTTRTGSGFPRRS